MWQKIMSSPEVVYIRGRFRASVASARVAREEGEDQGPDADQAPSAAIREPGRPLRGRLTPGTPGLRLKPARSS